MKSRLNKSDDSDLLEETSETSHRLRQPVVHRSLTPSSAIQVEATSFEDSPNILETSFRGHQLKVLISILMFCNM